MSTAYPLLMRSLLGVGGSRHLVLRYYLSGLHNSTELLLDLSERLFETGQTLIDTLEEHALLHLNGMDRIVHLCLTVNANILRVGIFSFYLFFNLIYL